SASASRTMWRASASRPAGTESSRSKMQTSEASVTALRSRAASVPGVKRALRMRDRGSAMAKCAAVSQVIDRDGAITRGGKDQRRPVLATGLEGDKTRIGGDGRQAHQLDQRPEELFFGAGDGDMAVRRREELEGDDARMARIRGALARYPGGHVPGGAVIVHGERDIIEVDANVPTMAGPPGIENGREQGQRRHQ